MMFQNSDRMGEMNGIDGFKARQVNINMKLTFLSQWGPVPSSIVPISVSDPDPYPLQETWIRSRGAKENRDKLT